MKKKTVRILALVVAIIIIIVLSSSIYIVQENEYASTVRFAKMIGTKDQPGLYFKTPFIDSIRIFPKAIKYYDISPSEVLTADKQNMTVDSYVLWRIVDPLKFYQTLGSVGVAEERLDGILHCCWYYNRKDCIPPATKCNTNCRFNNSDRCFPVY